MENFLKIIIHYTQYIIQKNELSAQKFIRIRPLV